METDKILVIGSSGQFGSILTKSLQEKFGVNNVVATDINENSQFNGHFEILDALDYDAIFDIVVRNEITQIYHLAAILSAKGESDPLRTWEININSFLNVLNVSVKLKIQKVFFPSSIAVFGPIIGRKCAFQSSILTPITVYGVSKVAGENWSNYYFEKYGLDIRSIRFPGIIGYQSLPGGGTTDYAIDIFHKAINGEKFECFLNENTSLPMIYMDDAIRATIELMDAPPENISIRTSYNLGGPSFSPLELVSCIQKIFPEFEVIYKPDFRQEIANSWPKSINDSNASDDWNWKPKYYLEEIVDDMINNLKVKCI